MASQFGSRFRRADGEAAGDIVRYIKKRKASKISGRISDTANSCRGYSKLFRIGKI